MEGSWIGSRKITTDKQTLILAIVPLIDYNVNVGGDGCFRNAAITKLVLFCTLAAVALIVAIALADVILEVQTPENPASASGAGQYGCFGNFHGGGHYRELHQY